MKIRMSQINHNNAIFLSIIIVTIASIFNFAGRLSSIYSTQIDSTQVESFTVRYQLDENFVDSTLFDINSTSLSANDSALIMIFISLSKINDLELVKINTTMEQQEQELNKELKFWKNINEEWMEKFKNGK